jgi:hypothetical protein
MAIQAAVHEAKAAGHERVGTGFVFEHDFALEDANGSHARTFIASMRVANGIRLGCSLLLPVGTANYVATLKAQKTCCIRSLTTLSMTPVHGTALLPL